MIALAVIAVLQGAVIAFLVWDRRRADPGTVELIALCDRLCQRLQAPQMATLEYHQAQVPTSEEAPAAVHPDSDEDYWEARETLADRLMAEEMQSGH